MRTLRVAAVVVARPALWPTAARQVRRLAPRRWWARPPFLPTPPREYLRFRLATQYGDADHAPSAHDVISYLWWCRQWDTLRRPRRSTAFATQAAIAFATQAAKSAPPAGSPA